MAPCVSQRRDGEINESGLTMVPRGYLRANLLMKDPASEHLISSDKSAKPIFRALQKIFNRLCASHFTPPPPSRPPPALSRLSARSAGRTGRAAETIHKKNVPRFQRSTASVAVKCIVRILWHHLYFSQVHAVRYSVFSFTRTKCRGCAFRNTRRLRRSRCILPHCLRIAFPFLKLRL